MRYLFGFLVLFCVDFAQISEYFPALDNRVIDKANMLRDDVKVNLIKLLKEEEEKSSNQIVVVTLKSLHRYDIEDFSLQLARHWKLGQKDKNNGILLLIAKDEKKIRIEVGYGLEGELTDEISHEIITYTISPAFKKGEFNEGILQGVEKIISAVNGKYQKQEKEAEKTSNPTYIFYIIGIPVLYILTLIFSAIGSLFKNNIFKRLGYSIFAFGLVFVVVDETFGFDFLTNIILAAIGSILYFIFIKDADDDSVTYYGHNGFSGGSFGGGGASGSWQRC